jgi:hypothetical protein
MVKTDCVLYTGVPRRGLEGELCNGIVVGNWRELEEVASDNELYATERSSVVS